MSQITEMLRTPNRAIANILLSILPEVLTPAIGE